METGEDVPPRIENWWPHLSIGARHRLLEHLDDTVAPEVREEVGAITGSTIDAGWRLSSEELGFISVQQEGVD